MPGAYFYPVFQGAEHWAKKHYDRQSWEPVSYWIYARPDNSGRIIPSGSVLGKGAYPFWYESWLPDLSDEESTYMWSPYHTKLHQRIRACGLEDSPTLHAAWNEWPDLRQKPMSWDAFLLIKSLIDDIREIEQASPFNWILSEDINESYIGPISYRNQIAAALERWDCYFLTTTYNQICAKYHTGYPLSSVKSTFLSSEYGWYGSLASYCRFYWFQNVAGTNFGIRNDRTVQQLWGHPKPVPTDYPGYLRYPIRPDDGYEEFPDDPCDTVLSVQFRTIWDRDFDGDAMPGIELYKQIHSSSPYNPYSPDSETLIGSWSSSEIPPRYDFYAPPQTNVPAYWRPMVFTNVTSWWDWDEVWGTYDESYIGGERPEPPPYILSCRLEWDGLTYPSGGSYSWPSQEPEAGENLYIGYDIQYGIHVYVDDIDDIGDTA